MEKFAGLKGQLLQPTLQALTAVTNTDLEAVDFATFLKGVIGNPIDVDAISIPQPSATKLTDEHTAKAAKHTRKAANKLQKAQQ
ncbi:hypothetical protein SARC_07968 [Sphaeroforma arctica JP610]|uniref:Uncharacterized protein n=1 Tax=Sphaeroforma arctica JP610 TaxID=667725 RepID=A0A0L0FUP9_9EUKA|nr:hypothetical protein SARC_07968 [Sphaeroforma arctica JP610]KNC79648.1 hypothetical protein SARC_07968 [Sphaeroforma arctica JP610]|eukprot:XP_014153550.1 hypothetical protein SARC_07968 [Sphaeroforma arctica JP610]